MLEWIGHSASAPGKIRPQAQTTHVRPIRAFQRYLPLLLAILLPLLQLGSVLHGLGHLSDPPRNDTADVSTDACALCAAYAMAGSTLPGVSPAWPLFTVLVVPGVSVIFSQQQRPNRLYFARAPPPQHKP